MALQQYLKIVAEKQGELKSDNKQKTREGLIPVIAVSHEVVSPRDAASGLPTGKRMHKPFVITMELDKTTPQLYKALVDNENLKTWVLKAFRPSSTGAEQQHYTVTLSDANIASISYRMANNKHPDLMKYAEYTEIAFTYRKIQWLWVDGGIESEDDWNAPMS